MQLTTWIYFRQKQQTHRIYPLRHTLHYILSQSHKKIKSKFSKSFSILKRKVRLIKHILFLNLETSIYLSETKCYI
jgi:hypothetical protein